jgi:hypothetical protein
LLLILPGRTGHGPIILHSGKGIFRTSVFRNRQYDTEERETWYLFHKEKEFGVKTAERRAIRVATSATPEDPRAIVDGPLNQGQIVPAITEGPTAITGPVKPGWLLYYDFRMAYDFG